MTKLNWQKLGRIFKADGQRGWMASHTAMPQALVMEGFVRVFFGARDSKNRPHIGYIDINPENPTEVISISKDPILKPGPWGHFDDNGLYPGSIIQNDERLLMYYMGRSNGESPMYYMAIGLAESLDGGHSFKRVSPSPVLGRTEYDPWMTSTPWVIKNNNEWIMYYLSGDGWENIEDRVSRYFIRSATSLDGVNWSVQGDTVIGLGDGETNIAAPTVWDEEGQWHMVFCTVNAQTKSYKLGYAISQDKLNWVRCDKDIGIDLSVNGWDSEAMAYPSVFKYKKTQYLLYSGNELGKEGIGLARLEKS